MCRARAQTHTATERGTQRARTTTVSANLQWRAVPSWQRACAARSLASAGARRVARTSGGAPPRTCAHTANGRRACNAPPLGQTDKNSRERANHDVRALGAGGRLGAEQRAELGLALGGRALLQRRARTLQHTLVVTHPVVQHVCVAPHLRASLCRTALSIRRAGVGGQGGCFDERARAEQ